MGIEKALVSPLALYASGNGVEESKQMTRKNRFKANHTVLKNNMKTAQKDIVTLAGGAAAAAGTAAIVSKSKAAQQFISKGVKAAMTALGNVGKEIASSSTFKAVAPTLKKAAGAIAALPGPAKIAGVAVGLLTFGLIKRNHDKNQYNNGKIVQNYIDKSQLEKSL